MAKILYGVMGNTHGHIMRTKSIIARLPQHEFYFIGGGRVPDAFKEAHPVLEVPVLRTVHHKQRVSVPRTIGQIIQRVLEIPKITRQISQLIDSWKPDVLISDREFFLPIAARMAGRKCLSIDHSHVMKACDYPVPHDQWLSWALATVNDKLLFDFTRHNLIVSFFHPPLKANGDQNELFGPVLRENVKDVTSSVGDYILVYQTSATFGALIDCLRQVPRKVVVYGFRNELAVEGNITFKPFHPRQILEDLAGCSYAVVNGGHNLICEALSYGKPVLCFPIATLYEQFINAWHVRSLGYGDFTTTRQPSPELFASFEKELEHRRSRIATGFKEGTTDIAARVDEIVRQWSA